MRPYDLLAQATLPQKRKKNRELLPNVERRASKQHVLRVNRYLGMLNYGRGLRQFQNIGKLHEWNLAVGCQTGKFPVPMPRMDKEYEPDSMSICSDQEQTQITGGEFIFKPEPAGLGCTGARLIDDFHRWNNDVASAVAKSGLAPCEKAATLWLNIGYGPWQSGAWFHAIITEGVRLPHTLKANSRLLMKYWPRILLDRKVGRSGSNHQRWRSCEGRVSKKSSEHGLAAAPRYQGGPCPVDVCVQSRARLGRVPCSPCPRAVFPLHEERLDPNRGGPLLMHTFGCHLLRRQARSEVQGSGCSRRHAEAACFTGQATKQHGCCDEAHGRYRCGERFPCDVARRPKPVDKLQHVSQRANDA